MKYKVIACKALFREFSLLASQTRTILDITYMRQGLHDTPDLLRRALQEEIDKVDDNADMHSNEQRPGRTFDAILLGYGCAPTAWPGCLRRNIRLSCRAARCIGLFWGSYKSTEYFDSHPGTYWYNASWIENGWTVGKTAV